VLDLEEFYNAGFGWICKRCERELKSAATTETDENLPRVWREGEAESKRPNFAAPVARWHNEARNQLVCPRCGITELFDKA
jgi:uncharacterized protein YdaU (DUF1376 family)